MLNQSALIDSDKEQLMQEVRNCLRTRYGAKMTYESEGDLEQAAKYCGRTLLADFSYAGAKELIEEINTEVERIVSIQ